MTSEYLTLIDVLRDQKQCDEDGTYCIVSRQAVDEAIATLAQLEKGYAPHPNADMYFAYNPEGFDTFKTLDEARKSAQESVDWYRDNIDDGWDEGVEQVCYGVILGAVVETENREPDEDEKEYMDCDKIVDYGLKHFREPTPASEVTDAMVERLAIHLATKESANYKTLDEAINHVNKWKRLIPEAREMLQAAIAVAEKVL